MIVTSMMDFFPMMEEEKLTSRVSKAIFTKNIWWSREKSSKSDTQLPRTDSPWLLEVGLVCNLMASRRYGSPLQLVRKWTPKCGSLVNFLAFSMKGTNQQRKTLNVSPFHTAAHWILPRTILLNCMRPRCIELLPFDVWNVKTNKQARRSLQFQSLVQDGRSGQVTSVFSLAQLQNFVSHKRVFSVYSLAHHRSQESCLQGNFEFGHFAKVSGLSWGLAASHALKDFPNLRRFTILTS